MDRSPGVWILGGYQSDFARNPTREARDFAALTAEVVDATLTAAAWTGHESFVVSGAEGI